MVCLHAMLYTQADYIIQGGGARYPYPKYVWSPAGSFTGDQRAAIKLMPHGV